MLIKLKLYRVYDPGEFSKCSWTEEYVKAGKYLPDIRPFPRYKDTLIMEGNEYLVHDIIHDYDKSEITIKCVRRVTHELRSR